MAKYGKVSLSPTRHDWQPVPLPEQVVLVTTVDGDGNAHVATKTRLSVMSYGPPTILVLACRNEYQTAKNIRATEQFVINVPGDDLVATSWIIGMEPQNNGPSLFDAHGLTPIPGETLKPPRIGECRAHVECEVTELVPLGEEVAAFGKVVAVSMNEDIVDRGNGAAQYKRLAPFFFLDSDWTASLGAAREVETPTPGPSHEVTILATQDIRAATAFYTTAFDWAVRMQSKGYVEFDLPGGRSLALCTRDGFRKEVGEWPSEVANGISNVQVYLRCEDLPRTIAKLHSAGAKPLSKLKTRGWGEDVAYFADPDGHIIAVGRPVRTVM